MLTFKKGDAVKFIDPQSSLIDVLDAQGWELQEDKPAKTEKKAK
jgi:hypothetical protein